MNNCIKELSLVEVSTPGHRSMENHIRNLVFIEEQNVDPSVEYDEFEGESVHYLLIYRGEPVGCIRYRWVGKEIKIERLAIIKEMRGRGFGTFTLRELVRKVKGSEPEGIFLHSQRSACGFYGKSGFISVGDIFVEADIDHIKMYLKDVR